MEDRFCEIRLSRKWGEFIDILKGNEKNEIKGQIFGYSKKEDLDKIGYRMEAFRGTVYEELLTPEYEFKKDDFETSSKAITNEYKQKYSNKYGISFNNDHVDNVRKEIVSIVKGWDIIKIKITKAGLATLFFEKRFIDEDIKEYAKKTRELLSPLHKETNLNEATIWITYIFLKEYEHKVKEKGKDNKEETTR